MEGIRGYSDWRWIMILEGIPTILLEIAAYFIVASDPISAQFLTLRDKEIFQVRRELDKNSMGVDDESDRIQSDQVLEGLKVWNVWVTSFGQIGVTLLLYDIPPHDHRGVRIFEHPHTAAHHSMIHLWRHRLLHRRVCLGQAWSTRNLRRIRVHSLFRGVRYSPGYFLIRSWTAVRGLYHRCGRAIRCRGLPPRVLDAQQLAFTLQTRASRT